MLTYHTPPYQLDDKEGKTRLEINICIDFYFELDALVLNYDNFSSCIDEHKAILVGLGNVRRLVILNPQSNDSYTNDHEMLVFSLTVYRCPRALHNTVQNGTASWWAMDTTSRSCVF
jgi:hypothetical protein